MALRLRDFSRSWRISCLCTSGSGIIWDVCAIDCYSFASNFLSPELGNKVRMLLSLNCSGLPLCQEYCQLHPFACVLTHDSSALNEQILCSKYSAVALNVLHRKEPRNALWSIITIHIHSYPFMIYLCQSLSFTIYLCLSASKVLAYSPSPRLRAASCRVWKRKSSTCDQHPSHNGLEKYHIFFMKISTCCFIIPTNHEKITAIKNW